MTIQKSLLLLLLAALLGCNKNDPVANADVWLPQALKSQFLFYPGSYWIFELPGTSFVDSVFVVETRLDTVPILHPGSKTVIGYKENLFVKYVSPFYGRYYAFVASSKDFCTYLGDESPCHKVEKWNLKGNSDTINQRAIIAYFPAEAKVRYSAGERTTNEVYLDSLLPAYTQADSLYNAVMRVIVSVDPTEQNQVSVRHFAPGVGLIRWQVPEYGFNWVAVRHKTIQKP